MDTDGINLFSTVELGPYELRNRIVMAPLTRSRAGDGNVPGPMNANYYAQRASAGLIIVEATQVSPQGVGYPFTPGIHSEEQVEGWRLVTNAVHGRGSKIFLQLWHVGRVSHPSLQPGGTLPEAPSAIAPEGDAFTLDGLQPFVTPRALETEEIPGIVEDYRKGAQNAMDAGFDGVEVHGANGYLLDQFLQDNSNRRTDQYGGSIENRTRLLLEVVEAVVDVWGPDRVGVRLSPGSNWMSMHDSDPKALFTYVVEKLNSFKLAYLHLIEPTIAGNVSVQADPSALSTEYFRPIFEGAILTAGDYTREKGNAALAARHADLVVFGRLFIANPDLPERFAKNASLGWPDRATFYGGDEAGYTDYPSLRDEEVYRDLRQRVLARDVALGENFDLDDLSKSLDFEQESGEYAMRRLYEEGFVSLHPEGGWSVTPIDAKASDEAFDARCAIELGVAELTVGQVSQQKLTGLRERLEVMEPLIAENRFVDFERYLEANTDYHEYLVSLADNGALFTSFRALSMKGLMARALGSSDESSDKVIEDHVRLTEAYEDGDLRAAQMAIREYTDLAKERARTVVEAAGGRV